MEEPLQFDRLPKENTKEWLQRLDDLALSGLNSACASEMVRRAMDRKRNGAVRVSV